MEGYRQKVLKLVWPEDDERHGLVVRAMRMSIDDIISVADMESGINKENASERLSISVDKCARMLISWNLEVPKRADDGSIVLDDNDEPVMEPVPANAAGLRRADPNLLYAIITAATDAMVGVRPPLSPPSTDGEQSLEASMPMETLSESPPNSDEPA